MILLHTVHWFYRTADSNTATYDRHKLSHIAYVIKHNILLLVLKIKIDENSSLTDGFQYDLMMILHSGLLFWATQ